MSAEELQAAIDDQVRQLLANKARLQELEAETHQAMERHRLREQLHRLTWAKGSQMKGIEAETAKRRRIDNDETIAADICEIVHEQRPVHVSDGVSTKLADVVHKAEYVWRMEGFSWMECGLEQHAAGNVSTCLRVGDEVMHLHYSPWPHRLCHDGQHHGSLAIVLRTRERIALRYRICVKARDGYSCRGAGSVTSSTTATKAHLAYMALMCIRRGIPLLHWASSG